MPTTPSARFSLSHPHHVRAIFLSHLEKPSQSAHSILIFWLLDPARPPPIKWLKSLFLLEGVCTAEYKILSQVMNINECDCVTVLKHWITAILTSSVWKANKMAVREQQAWETEERASVSIPFLHQHQTDEIQGLLDVCANHCVTKATEKHAFFAFPCHGAILTAKCWHRDYNLHSLMGQS